MTDSIPPKPCKRCGVVYSATKQYFYGDKRHEDGLRYLCKVCDSRPDKTDIKNRRLPKYPGIVDIPEGVQAKRCVCCDNTFPITKQYFYASGRGRRSSDGLREKCKWCVSKKCIDIHAQKDKSKKVCPGCKQEYPRTSEFFCYQVKSKGKLQPLCKNCTRVQFKGYYHENKDLNRDERNARQRKNRRVSYASYHAREIAYYAANREYYNWKQRNNPKRRLQQYAHAHKRRAITYKVGGTFTSQDVQRQMRTQKRKCYWCGVKLTKYHIDHVIPLTREGTSNASWNIVISCPTCNISRNNRLPHEWPQGGRLL